MKKRILIIDNEPDLLALLNKVLTDEGLDVFTEEKVNNIFSLVNRISPDIVVIDYILNGINGGELCLQLKANPKTRHIPVIIYSTYPKVLELLNNYGCNEFIAKPFDLFDFIDRIKNYFATEECLVN